ncbi:sensor histidine kinase [Methylobacterium iners]|uniref:histidine kinase n=1 Tax=Methylobacterium iners TaxID=418707 RepID=A0ABQ4RY52_9HYPH|nr:sensor histidine kinase [Methylobacterium iners]GJD95781.1 hypothetical protein OCOJLMKI_2995 [Methylobacterium iners]
MEHLDLTSLRGAPSSHWDDTETVLLMLADFMAAGPDAPGRQIAKLERENARLVAHCEQQKLVMAELGHRLKNSLALVQAMVNQTLRGEVSVEGAREALTARIAALGRSHALLMDESWSGATVRQVVEGALLLHAERAAPDRVHVAGPSVHLTPRQMLALSMALHELGTNAAKYGALSVITGRVEVVWSMRRRRDGRWLHLEWREAGGPTVIPPTRRGFGSKLIERALRDALEGEVTLSFDPAGVTCTVTAFLKPSAPKLRQRAQS